MKALKALLKIFAAGIIAMAVLSIFVYGYSYSGIHIANPTGATDYVWRPNEIKTTMTEGFAWERMDSNGFHNVSSNTDNIDILIMGSSHMEAVQMKAEETVAGRLNILNPDMYAYNIGMSGHDIYRCVDNIDSAINEYKPGKCVVIETSQIDLSMQKMQEVIRGKATPIPSYDAGLLYKLQLIPAFRPIYKQLVDWKDVDTKTTTSSDESSFEVMSAEDDEVYCSTLRLFLYGIKEATNDVIKPIIVYHPSETLKGDGNVAYLTDSEKLKTFQTCCDEVGIGFIDMTESFKEMYEEQHVLAHGFSNTKAGQGHLNRYGHDAIAKAIYKMINEDCI